MFPGNSGAPYAPPVIYDATGGGPPPYGQQRYGAPPPAYGAPGYAPGPAPYGGYPSAGPPPPAGGWQGPPGYGAPPPMPQPQSAVPPQYGQNPHLQGAAATAYSQFAPAVAAPQKGRKKALLIGCCYPGTQAALQGCINDIKCIQYLLKTKFGYEDSGILMLRDDTSHPDFVSTRRNIMRGIQWLLSDLRPGDSLFFHFSGHGSQVRDQDGDEDDGYDETICPSDYKYAGQIVDDELNAVLIRPLPPGVTMHAIIDACHSGTALDLCYRARTDSSGRFYWHGQPRGDKATSGGTVFQFGACKDYQTAQDTNGLSKSAYTGAATYSFIEAIESGGPNQTYAAVLTSMRRSLSKLSRTQGGGGGGGGGGMSMLSGGIMGLVAGLMLEDHSGMAAGQTPVCCCDKPVDLYVATLSI